MPTFQDNLSNFRSYAKAQERVDDLQIGGLGILQDPSGFRFGIDAVLLSEFVQAQEGAEMVEFGTGTGVISLLLSQKLRPSEIVAFEIQADVADMARRSVEMNGLSQTIRIVHAPLQEAPRILGRKCDVVFSNPPYMEAGKGILSASVTKRISRHETHMTLEELFLSASRLLRHSGMLYMVHRPERLCDLISASKQYGLEPRTLRMVHPAQAKDANIMLLSFKKTANRDFKVLPPLFVYQEDGRYTPEIFDIYHRVGIDKNDKEDKEDKDNKDDKYDKDDKDAFSRRKTGVATQV